MVSDDYWEKDELEDRQYHAREREKRYSSPPTVFSRLRWRVRRSRTFLMIGVLLLVLWRWLRSDQAATRRQWSRFAYSQYTTDTHSLCNSLMVFESLHRLGSQADRVLMYPKVWAEQSDDHINWKLLHKAEEKYRVQLRPVELLESDASGDKPGTLDDPTSDWDMSITKLQAFSLSHYERVLHLDSDITLLQHMDELFSLPRAPIAMPHAYWSRGEQQLWPYTSLIMLIEPDKRELSAMMEILRQWRQRPDYARSKKYDMDLLNYRFSYSTRTLPHRPYAMLSAEFRASDHGAYLGTNDAVPGEMYADWDPDKAIEEAKLVHFSDWPLPKPWVMWPNEGLVEMQPDCGGDFTKRCREREIWKKLYEDFRARRTRICRISPVPAPDWKKWKNMTGAS